MMKKLADIDVNSWMKDDDGNMSVVIEKTPSASGNSISVVLYDPKDSSTNRTDFYDKDTLVETKNIPTT